MFIVGAFAYLAFSLRKGVSAPSGSERDEVVLVCIECNAESHVTSAEGTKLKNEAGDSSGAICPKCRKPAAYIATLRCPNPQCQRYVPRRPGVEGTAFVCPYCKKSLADMGD